MNRNEGKYNDNITMAKRCLLLSIRNPDIVLTSVMLPALLMLLFVALFGKIIQVEGISYVNYIVPGVLLQSIGQCSSSTAIGMNRDITGGIINRFCTMAIKKSSILTGHVIEAVLRNLLTSIIVLFVAVVVGFRPLANCLEWLVVFVLLIGIILVISWLSIYIGIVADSAEGASVLSVFAVILPYLSSGFVPTEQMPRLLAVFAENQPMTPIINTMRNAFLGRLFEPNTFLTAILWCAALTMVFYILSVKAFRKKSQN